MEGVTTVLQEGRRTDETVIRATHGWASLHLRELWTYRELLVFLTWRDIKVRYKQAIFGVAWAVLQPFLTMVVFSAVFGGLLNVSSGGIPYPLFSYSALLPWMLFSGTLNRASSSLVGNSQLLSKVYFPRLVVPLSATLAGLPDFLISLVVFLGMMAYYRWPLTPAILCLPLFTLLALAAALAVSLWLSALDVLYRDVQYAVPFIIQLWMFLSPVVYSAGAIPSGPLKVVYSLNPMVGVINGFRWGLVGGPAPELTVLISCVVVLVVFVTGLFYFRRMERSFADVV
jgi:lipopolysaccharide transport system permease protein